jgi:hypothetical protein
MTKLKKSAILLSFALLFVACSQDHGSKLESAEMDIFFTNQSDEEIARKIAVYWKENHFLGDKKQFLQLNRKGKSLELKLIAKEKFSVASFSFDERALLKGLQDSLQKVVEPEHLELVIADKQFNTLYNINQ